MKLIVIFLIGILIFLLIKFYKLRSQLKKCLNFDGTFFTSRQAELIFYLTKLEGKQRNELLGLTSQHYTDKKLAQSWYRDICFYVHPDKGGNNTAFTVLQGIYEVLMEED